MDYLNQIIHGDCLNIMPMLPDHSVDMVLCDLPYGNTEESWDSIIPMGTLWKQYERLVKPRGAIALTAVQPFTSLLVTSNLKWYRHSWIWVKDRGTGFQLANIRPMRIHEDILVFGKLSPCYIPIKISRDKPIKRGGISHSKISFVRQHDGRKPIYHDRFPESVIYFPHDHRNRIHPTQKPVALFEYLIKTYTHEGDIVLDNCSGSGTSAIAAIHTGRQYICIEKDETYWRKSVERVEHMEPWQADLFDDAV